MGAKCDRYLGIWHLIIQHVIVLEQVAHKGVSVVVVGAKLFDQVCRLDLLAPVPTTALLVRLHLYVLLIERLEPRDCHRTELVEDEDVLVVVVELGPRLLFLTAVVIDVGEVFGDFGNQAEAREDALAI